MDYLSILLAIPIGFCAMLSGGFWGLGGGWFIMPALLLMGIDIQTAIVASLLQMVPSTMPTVIKQFPSIGWRKNSWGWNIAVPVCFFSLVGSFFGKPIGDWLFAVFQSRKPQETLYMFVMLLVLLDSIRSSFAKRPSSIQSTGALPSGVGFTKQFFSAFAGILTGVISSLFGIGGGAFVRPVLKSFLHVPENIAGRILRLSVLLVAISGSVSYLIGGIPSLQQALCLAFALTAGGMPAFALGAKMHSKVIAAGNDRFADSTFAFFIFTILVSLLCKIMGWILAGKIIIILSGLILLAFLATVTSMSVKKIGRLNAQ